VASNEKDIFQQIKEAHMSKRTRDLVDEMLQLKEIIGLTDEQVREMAGRIGYLRKD